jgi:hypothetical protein
VQITPKALLVTGLAATGKDYDGTPAASLTGTAVLPAAEAVGAGTPSDGKPYMGDALALAGTATGAFADPDVGAAKPVTITGLTLTGTGAANYSLAQPAGLTAGIAARALTITAGNQGKTYGQTVAFGSGATQFTSIGLQHGETIDSVTLACGGGNATAAVAGSPYTITPGAATGGTYSAGNYTISYVPGMLAVDKADQTITFDALPAKTFGDAPFNLTATADSGLAVGYISSDPAVAGVVGSTVTILQAGGTTITASQPGDANHHAATPVAQLLTINAPPLAPYATWAGDPAQGLTAGVNDGPADDPDHDGMTNMQEFAFGLNPSNGASVNPVTMPLDQTTGRFQYTRRVGSGLTYQTITSTDLGTWAPDTGATEEVVTTNGDVQTVTIHVTTAPVGGRLFVRVRAE